MPYINLLDGGNTIIEGRDYIIEWEEKEERHEKKVN